MNPFEIFESSNGEATKDMYAKLEQLGPVGVIAMNLFRAQKCSTRAKLYHGRQFKDAAYERKQWSMGLLAKALTEHAAKIGITWGWKQDPIQTYHTWVLYVDLPSGQVSFHSPSRGLGPDYPADWDRASGASPGRICSWVKIILETGPSVA